jgi:HEAT repeat protein
VRRQAALSLGALLTPADEAALQFVVRFVRTERDPTTRSFAALSIAESGWPGAEAPLLDLFRAGDTLERSFSAIALGVLVRSVGDPALTDRIRPLLRAALEAADSDEKKKSLALAVGLAGDRTAGPLIRRLANEACDPPTMAAYAVGLGLVGDRDARPLLIDLLKQNCYQHLREDAARALGMLGDEDSIAVLVACLRGRNPDYYRGSAALALGYLVEPEEAGPLTDVLGDAGEIPTVRAQCARALGRILDPGAIPVSSRLTRHVDLFLPIDTLGILFRLL